MTTKPTIQEIEFLHYGSYFNEDEEYLEEMETVFEAIASQYSVGNGEYVSESVEVLLVVKNTETGELWGAQFAPNSWHEEPLNLEDDDILPVELQTVCREEYVFVE